MLWQKYIVSFIRANFGKDVCLLKCLFVMRLTENLIFFGKEGYFCNSYVINLHKEKS